MRIGIAELLLIFIVATCLLGPQGVIEFAHSIGIRYRELRRELSEVASEIGSEVADVQEEIQSMQKEVKSVQEEINKPINLTKKKERLDGFIDD